MQIESQETIQDLQSADFPHLKTSDRKKRWAEIQQVAFPRDMSKVVEVPGDEFAKRLGALLNG